MHEASRCLNCALYIGTVDGKSRLRALCWLIPFNAPAAVDMRFLDSGLNRLRLLHTTNLAEYLIGPSLIQLILGILVLGAAHAAFGIFSFKRIFFQATP